jgi:glycosyltransferase involved in cell wall biosynthesis
MKVFQVAASDSDGGAARAAYRLHQALRSIHIDSQMYVSTSLSGDPTVLYPKSTIAKFMKVVRSHVDRRVTKLLKTENRILHSPAVLSTAWPRRLNESDADLIHLHWICGGMMSIEDIGRITKPTLWTLHDMWAFCGAEHHTYEGRYRQGYTSSNRPTYETGVDLNRWTWQRKRLAWKRPVQIVTPSRWLADCVRQSKLMQGWPVDVIPNCLDTERWQPIDQRVARQLLNLPQNCPLVTFGAIGGGQDPIKGFDLLLAALQHLRGHLSDLELVIFGESRPRVVPDVGFKIHYMGHLHDDLSLRAVYSAADVMVVPSRQEVLPQTAYEASACGTPVVAFHTSGLLDIIVHQETGWLAPTYDTESMADGIRWILEDQARRSTLGKQARKYVVNHFSVPIVANQYRQLYEKLVG